MAMKQSFSFALFAGALALLLAVSAFADQHKRVIARVDGLSCPFCAYGLEKKLKSIEGIDKLEIKVNDGLAILSFKESAEIDTAIIIQKIKEGGFTPRGLTIEDGKHESRQITMTVQGMTCDNCVARVKKALEKVDCVRDVKVDLKKGQAALTCTGKNHDPKKFVDIINDLGFHAELQDK